MNSLLLYNLHNLLNIFIWQGSRRNTQVSGGEVQRSLLSPRLWSEAESNTGKHSGKTNVQYVLFNLCRNTQLHRQRLERYRNVKKKETEGAGKYPGKYHFQNDTMRGSVHCGAAFIFHYTFLHCKPRYARSQVNTSL